MAVGAGQLNEAVLVDARTVLFSEDLCNILELHGRAIPWRFRLPWSHVLNVAEL
jgi:hypothetical protein